MYKVPIVNEHGSKKNGKKNLISCNVFCFKQKMGLMIECCLMNGYCPYYSLNEFYLSCIIIILFIIVIDIIRK